MNKQKYIKDAYVSLEVAQLLKDKGFNEPCHAGYCKNPQTGAFERIGLYYPAMNSDYEGEEMYTAPTQQLAMRWLREVHGIIIVQRWCCISREKWGWSFEIWQQDHSRPTITSVVLWLENINDGIWETYEEAVEHALKYSLQNMVS